MTTQHRLMAAIAPLAAALALGACTTSRPGMSYVDPELSASDARTLVDDSLQHLSGQLAPAHTTLVLDPPKDDGSDLLTPAMVLQLRAAGYGVTQAERKTGPKAGQGTQLRYLASPLDGGVLLRLQYLDREAAKFYPRATDGSLIADAPFVLRGPENKP